MDRTEKLDYLQRIEQYYNDHKVYDLFEKLLKELIINKPEDPISYLIERLQRPDTKRIFITGLPGTDRRDVSLAISESMKYSCLSVDHLLDREINKKLENAHQIEKNYNANTLVDDDIVIELVRNQLIKYEEEKVSYIIEGFPRNRTQAIFLQSIGLLPDNVIILTTSREKAMQNVFKKIKDKNSGSGGSSNNNNESHSEGGGTQLTDEEIKILAKNSIDEAELNIRAVEDVFSGFYLKIQVDKFESKNEVVDELAKLLKFKNKTNAARRPPKIILATPPSMDKDKIGETLAQNLQIIHVSIKDLINKEIEMKNENSKIILSSLENNDPVNDKFILKLLEDRLSASDCVINGWVVTGFPMTLGQLNFIDNMSAAIKPSLLGIVDMDEKTIEEKAKKIRYDKYTGKYYEVDGKEYNELPEDVKGRLIIRKQESEEILKKRIENWKNISNVIMTKDWIKLNGEDEINKICQLIEDKIGYDS